MLITDMRMESDAAGVEVIKAAQAASYHPAIALLTAFPVADEDWQEMGADKLLVKPMHTQILLRQIEDLIHSHEAKLAKPVAETHARAAVTATSRAAIAKKAKAPARKSAAKKAGAKKAAARKPAAKKPAKKAPAKIAKKTARTTKKPVAAGKVSTSGAAKRR
jgi:DNA-binding response OmpR family regulator